MNPASALCRDPYCKRSSRQRPHDAALVERRVEVNRGWPILELRDRLWLDAATGVPLRRERDVPSRTVVGPLPSSQSVAIEQPH